METFLLENTGDYVIVPEEKRDLIPITLSHQHQIIILVTGNVKKYFNFLFSKQHYLQYF